MIRLSICSKCTTSRRYVYNQTQTLLNNNIPLERISQDTKINNIGRNIIDMCKNNNLFIVNGRIGKDKHMGNLTFRNKTLIDYTLASSDFMPLFTEFEVVDLDLLYSDVHRL